MSEQEQTDDVIILVDFGDGHLRQAADHDISDKDLLRIDKKSREAVNKAFDTIKWVAQKADSTLKNLHEQPDEVELEFGIAITTKAGVMVLQDEAGFHIKAKLVWKKST